MTLDGKTSFAILIVIGFVGLTGIGMFHSIPAENVKTIDGAMVALGTALGAAVMALLRSDRMDEKRTENTGAAFRAIEATAAANPTTQPVQVVNPPSDPVNVQEPQP